VLDQRQDPAASVERAVGDLRTGRALRVEPRD